MLAILCGLSLMLGQLFPVLAASRCATPADACCGCGGKMACCSEKSAPAAPEPATAVRVGVENQILSPVPATVFWVLAAAGTVSICPVSDFSAPLHAAPIFARHCVRLI